MNLNLIQKTKQFFADSKHVLSVSYKPDMPTFKRTLKIVLFGALIIGILGYIISIIIDAFI